MIVNQLKLKLFRVINGFIFRKPSLHCIGDSHVAVFEYIKNRQPFSLPFQIETCKISGATISGIQNPNSKTQAKKIISKYQDKVKPRDYVLTQFGEVDCGFVIWYRSEKYQESVEQNLDKALYNYEELLNSIKAKLGHKVLVCQAPLPTIKDEVNIGKVALQRKGINATQSQRTELTLRFNERLKEIAKKIGVICIETNYSLLGKQNIVDDSFVNANELDHHLDNAKYSKILISAINERFLKES